MRALPRFRIEWVLNHCRMSYGLVLTIPLLALLGARFTAAPVPSTRNLLPQEPIRSDAVLVVWSVGDTRAGGGARSRSVLGLSFVAGPGRVVAHLPTGVSDTDGLAVSNAGGTEWAATLLYHDSPSGLTLLDVAGLSVDPFAFVLDSLRTEQRVWGATRNREDGTLSFQEGLAESRQTLEVGEPPMIVHTAYLAGQFNRGAPLLNQCGEIVGVIPEAEDYAIPAAQILDVFRLQGLEATRAPGPCLGGETELQPVREAEVERPDPVVERPDPVVERPDPVVERPDPVVERPADTIIPSGSESTLLNVWIVLSALAAALLALAFWMARVRSQSRSKPDADQSKGHGEVAERRTLPPPAVPSIVLSGADRKGNRFSLSIPADAIGASNGAVVGRNPHDSDIVLDQPDVSRRHFRLHMFGDKLFVEDLQSTNGTRVGNAVLTPGVRAELREGDTLRIGTIALRVRVNR